MSKFQKTLSIEDAHIAAKHYGGKCLSAEYVSSNSLLEWKCKVPLHSPWEDTLSHVKDNERWCRDCKNKAKAREHSELYLPRMHAFASSHLGKCLSSEYVNSNSPLKWECEKGHTFEKSFTSAKVTFCSDCKKINNKLRQKQEALREAGKRGKQIGANLLSNHYKNNTSDLNWKCEQGHPFTKSRARIKEGCPVCKKLKNKLRRKQSKIIQLEEMRQIARGRGGECLSEKYKDANTKLEWTCADPNHPSFFKEPNKVKNSYEWCRYCQTSTSEEICRAYFQQLFKTGFPSVRPSWLKNKNNKPLELDGYSKKLGVAFEHNGSMHYYDRFDSPKSFKDTQENDLIKKGICQERGIALIVIRELFAVTKVKNLGRFIFDECTRYKIPVPNNFWKRERNIDLNPIWLSNKNQKELIALQEKAHEQDGRCLTTVYKGPGEKADFICKEGHPFSAYPANIKKGHWCGKCHGNAKLSIDDIRQYAKKHGGRLLSKEYKNSTSGLKWECKRGHQFTTSFSNLKHRCCKDCRVLKNDLNHQRKMLAEAKAVARTKGGELLSKRYEGNTVPLEFSCGVEALKISKWIINPHPPFKRPWRKLREGKWCPLCDRQPRIPAEKILDIIEAKQGKCLWHGNMTMPEGKNRYRYIVKCSNPSHDPWLIAGSHLRGYKSSGDKGSWCQTCYNESETRTIWGNQTGSGKPVKPKRRR